MTAVRQMRTDEQAGNAAADLVRWAVTTRHHDNSRTGTRYDLTPEGDYKAWIDRLSTELAKDRADITRTAARRHR